MKKRAVSLFCFLALLLTGCSFINGSSSSSQTGHVSSSLTEETVSSTASHTASSPETSSHSSDDVSSSEHSSEPAHTSSDEPSSSSDVVPPSSESIWSSDEPTSSSQEPSSFSSDEPSSSSDEPSSSSESEPGSSDSSWSEDSSSTSEETDKRLYVFVTNETPEGFFDVHIDAKVETKLTSLYAESVIVLDEGIDIEAENLQWYIYAEHLGNIYFGENIVAIGKLHLGFNVCYPQIHFGKALRSIDYLHVSLGWDALVASNGKNRADIYFGGDCPEMEDGTLYNNGFSGVMIHYHQGAKGFKTFMQTASTTCIEDEAFIPDLSISEYVLRANRKARELAKSIYDRSVEIGNDEFLLFPIGDLDFYFELKEFVLDLTAKCASNYEKARVIFDWIVENIEYDDAYATASVEEIFTEKRAVCAGYSFLYHDMLAAVGIPSFYTRGAPVHNLPNDDIETFIRASFDPSGPSATHGWVYAIIDGKAVCCDPTWGDFDLTDEALSATRLIFQVDGIQVLYDDRLYPLIQGPAIVAYEGEYYFVVDGVGSSSSEIVSFINEVLTLRFRTNLNSKVTHGAESFSSFIVIPYGAVYHDGLFYFDDPESVLQRGFSMWWYCMPDGKTIDFLLLLRYMNEEQKRYGTVFQNQFDLGFCFMHEGMMYLEYEPDKLMLFAAIDMPTSFTVPTSINGKRVTALGGDCFAHMDSLEEVVIPEGVEWLAGSCFSWCSHLTSVSVPSTITEFGNCMFDYCPSLTDVTLAEGITLIPNGTFSFCTALEHIDIPSTVTCIEDNSFVNCTALKSITLPAGLEELQEYAFWYCTSLQEVFIPANVKEIGEAAFGFCPKLTSISVDPDNPYFDSRQGCNAIIRTETDTLVCGCKTMAIPEDLRGIEAYSCAGILGVDTIAIPSGVTYIDDFAFYGCETLQYADFGE
ncbi:MAG: leucine-rich repeat protein, partial [Bacilli bacterium]|nr:leucine-rich repeat protein [Bacilli bacterium]